MNFTGLKKTINYEEPLVFLKRVDRMKDLDSHDQYIAYLRELLIEVQLKIDVNIKHEIQKEDFITKPGKFPWRMHEDDYKRYQDALSKLK